MQEALISLAVLFFQFSYQIEAYRLTIDIVFSQFLSEKDSFLFSFCFYKKGDGGKDLSLAVGTWTLRDQSKQTYSLTSSRITRGTVHGVSDDRFFFGYSVSTPSPFR